RNNMETKNTDFDEAQALKLIESTIQQARNRMGEDGFIFLLWGWIVLSGSLMSYIFLHIGYAIGVGIAWAVLSIAGGFISGHYYRKKRIREGGYAHVSRLIGYVWGATGLGAGIFYFYLIINGPGELINPFVLCAAGIATFATGRVIRFKPLIAGGISFWIFALFALIFRSDIQFLLSAAAMITGYLIPGYILRSIYRKSHV
ncbi:MAG: hypothetical protein ACE5DN_03300, partial [Flavobacteriales bacterium]